MTGAEIRISTMAAAELPGETFSASVLRMN